MAHDLDELAAFRESATRLDEVMREQDRVIEGIIADAERAIDRRVREEGNRREEAERTARTARDELWKIDHEGRYARSDDERLEYAEQTRREAVALAEAQAEAEARARRAAAWEDELDDCRREFAEAAFKVRQLLNGPGNRYAETLGLSVMRLEEALQAYYDTDAHVSGKHR